MTVKFMRPEEMVLATLARWCIYGEQGMGKSTIGASVPTNEPTLLIRTPTEQMHPYLGLPHITAVTVERWDDCKDVYAGLRAGFADPDVRAGRKPYFKWVIWDTATRIQGLAARKITGADALSEQDELKLLTTAPKSPKGWDQWADIGALASELMRDFHGLPCNMLYLWQEITKTPKFEQDAPASTGPVGTPVFVDYAKEVNNIFGRLYAEQEGGDKSILGDGAGTHKINRNAVVPRYLLMGKHPRYFAKGPTHVLGYVLKDPTIPKLSESLKPNPFRVGG